MLGGGVAPRPRVDGDVAGLHEADQRHLPLAAGAVVRRHGAHRAAPAATARRARERKPSSFSSAVRTRVLRDMTDTSWPAASARRAPTVACVLRHVGERVERVPPHGVLVGHLADLVVGHGVGREDRVQLLGRGRPHRVAVRVVGLPAHVVDADAPAQLDADRVADEAGEEVLAEHLAGEAAAEVLLRPGVVHLVGAVDAVEEVGDPPGAALGQGDAQVGIGLDHPRPQQVGRGRLDVHGLQRDHHVGRRVDGGDRQPARRPEVHRQDVPVSTQACHTGSQYSSWKLG